MFTKVKISANADLDLSANAWAQGRLLAVAGSTI